MVPTPLDPERLLLAWIGQRFNIPTDRRGVNTPAAWTGRTPFYQVKKVGGDRAFNLHRPRMILTLWGPTDTREGLADAASELEDVLTYELPTSTGGFSLGLAGVTQSMTWQFYTNTDIDRYAGTFRFTIHQA